MKKDKKKEPILFRDPFDGEYIGNIWGWKYSLIGAAIILFFLTLMIYRHYTLGVSFGGTPEEVEKMELVEPAPNNE